MSCFIIKCTNDVQGILTHGYRCLSSVSSQLLQQTLLSIITEIIDLDHKKSGRGQLGGKPADLQVLSKNRKPHSLDCKSFTCNHNCCYEMKISGYGQNVYIFSYDAI